MNTHLTIAYMTNRKNEMSQWFFDSIKKQMGIETGRLDTSNFFRENNVSVVLVDFLCSKQDLQDFPIKWIQPKPNVWNGEHRLTKENWFAAASARNTALCHAKDGWILYVDDLSVCCPGFWQAVQDAMKRPGTITCGAYRKVKELVVENGEIKSFKDFPAGWDTRWHQVNQDLSPCGGEWLYGASLVAPVEALLTVNGWNEGCDSLGSEDYITGMGLENAGYKFVYDRRLLTFESEEHHHIEPAFKRSDYGVSPNDFSHQVLNQVKNGLRYFPNFFPEGGIRKLREKILAGEPFPPCGIPEHHPYTGIALKDL